MAEYADLVLRIRQQETVRINATRTRESIRDLIRQTQPSTVMGHPLSLSELGSGKLPLRIIKLEIMLLSI